MSDTPRTDELAKRDFITDGVWIRHARELERENAVLRATLDAIIAADERAVKLWRAAHPGNELVIPDRAKLVGWLLEQNAALRELVGTLGAPNHINVPIELWRELRKDKERLDWLTNSLGWIIVGYPEADPSMHATEDNTLADAWRAAIDAARKEAHP